jgi:hypothetical protein
VLYPSVNTLTAAVLFVDHIGYRYRVTQTFDRIGVNMYNYQHYAVPGDNHLNILSGWNENVYLDWIAVAP